MLADGVSSSQKLVYLIVTLGKYPEINSISLLVKSWFDQNIIYIISCCLLL